MENVTTSTIEQCLCCPASLFCISEILFVSGKCPHCDTLTGSLEMPPPDMRGSGPRSFAYGPWNIEEGLAELIRGCISVGEIKDVCWTYRRYCDDCIPF